MTYSRFYPHWGRTLWFAFIFFQQMKLMSLIALQIILHRLKFSINFHSCIWLTSECQNFNVVSMWKFLCWIDIHLQIKHVFNIIPTSVIYPTLFQHVFFMLGSKCLEWPCWAMDRALPGIHISGLPNEANSLRTQWMLWMTEILISFNPIEDTSSPIAFF